MTALDHIRPARQLDAVEAARITTSWPDLLKLPIQTDGERDEIVQAIHDLQTPPERAWVMARVAALLSQYYAADVPQSIVKMMAEDWAEAIGDYPQWCITKAVRWWKSADNPERKRRPLEGDIEAICKREYGVVKIAQLALRRYENGVAPIQLDAHRPPVDREAANRILAEHGFAPKRFGGNDA